MKIPTLFAVVIATAFVVLSGPAAQAEDVPTPAPSGTAAPALTWTVRPADANGTDGRTWVEETVDPGAVVDEHLAVSNFSTEAVTFALAAADGYFTPGGYFTLRRPDEDVTDAGGWITFAEQSVTVAAGATVVVPFTVTVPDNATPGDHAAGVAAGMIINGTDGGGAAVGLNSRVGFRVMLQVTGELTSAVDVADLTADYDMSWNPFVPGRVTVSATAENTGNTWVHVTTSASAGGASADAGERDLLPGESADLAATIRNVWPLGPISADVTADGVPNADGVAAASATQTITVWALPIPQLLTLAALALIVWSTVALRRRDKKKLAAAVEAARSEAWVEALAARGTDD